MVEDDGEAVISGGLGRRRASLSFPLFLPYKLLRGRCASPLFLLFILFPPPAWSISLWVMGYGFWVLGFWILDSILEGLVLAG